MTAVSDTPIRTLADLLERLGGVPLERIRFKPYPGTATEADVIEADDHEDRLCELVDGVLVEKAMGYVESRLAAILIRFIETFVDDRNLGLVTGEAGMTRLFPGLVRIPDVAFASWARVPGGKLPEAPMPDLVPDLVVEVLSRSNTPKEMARKRREYFEAGVRAVWEVDGKARTVAVYSAPERKRTLAQHQTLTGGKVLPGFSFPLRELFGRLDRRAP